MVNSDWFNTASGVHQWDNLSHIVFSVFINELVHEINTLSAGVTVGARHMSMLLYADVSVCGIKCE